MVSQHPRMNIVGYCFTSTYNKFKSACTELSKRRTSELKRTGMSFRGVKSVFEFEINSRPSAPTTTSHDPLRAIINVGLAFAKVN